MGLSPGRVKPKTNINDNDRPVDGPTHSDSDDYTEETHMSYGHQGRESLNIFNPISDQEKLKVSLTKIFISKVLFVLKTLVTCCYLICWST
jgi:hypothetical protein